MIIICSHNSTVRKRWKEALGDGAVGGEFVDFKGLRAFLSPKEDALILLHLSLPNLNGAEGVMALRQAFPQLKLLIFVDKPDDEEGLALLRNGVYGYCNTYISSPMLSRAVNAASDGDVWVGWDLMQRLIQDIKPEFADDPEDSTIEGIGALGDLTEREAEIAQHVALGASNKRIANNLNITERTVKAHLSAIYRKAGVNDRLQLALLVKRLPA